MKKNIIDTIRAEIDENLRSMNNRPAFFIKEINTAFNKIEKDFLKEDKLWATIDGIIDILLSPKLPLHKRIQNHLKLVEMLEDKDAVVE